MAEELRSLELRDLLGLDGDGLGRYGAAGGLEGSAELGAEFFDVGRK
jgi:hypothetical protein